MRHNHISSRVLFSTLASLALASVLTSTLIASGSSKLTYQGSLKDNGLMVSGQKSFEFRLTDDAGSAVFWTSGPQTLTVTDGLYKADLEVDSSALDHPNVHMETWVDGSILLPREPVTSAPYAILSRELASGATAQGRLIVKENLKIGGTTDAAPAAITIQKDPVNPTMGETMNLLSAGAAAEEISGDRQLLLQQWKDGSTAQQYVVGNGFVSGTSGPVPNDGPISKFQALGFQDNGAGLFTKKNGGFFPSVFSEAASGKVGIGTESPTETLSVNGTLSVKNTAQEETLRVGETDIHFASKVTSTKRIEIPHNVGDKIGFGTLVYSGPSAVNFIIGPNEMGLLFLFGNSGANTDVITRAYVVGSAAVYHNIAQFGGSNSGGSADFSLVTYRLPNYKHQIVVFPSGDMGNYQIVYLRLI